MIIFDQKNNGFLLSGKKYSYALHVTQSGYIQHLYFGKKIDKADLTYLVNYYGITTAPRIDDFNIDMATDGMLAEIGSYGRGDFHEATVISVREDGSAMSRFKFFSYKIQDGVKKLQGMPCIRHTQQTLTITLKDDFSDTYLDLNYSVSDESNVLVRNIVIHNDGNQKLNIKRAYSFCVDLPNSKYSVMRLAGRWARERYPIMTDVGQGTIRIDSNRGYSSHQLNPFISVVKDGCMEEQGECYGFALIYSGNFAMTVEEHNSELVRVQGGINDYMFEWQLKAGESFETPQAALCYSSEGLGEMSRSFADFWRDYIINPKWVNRSRPIVINNWEATYFDFNNEKLFEIIDEAAKLGVDTFVLDDGWFGKRDNDKTSLGDWFVNEKKLHGGLKTVIEHCKQKGLKFGLWFEPEMISEDSELFRTHPDWALKKEGVEPCRGRNQLVLDFTRSEVVEGVYQMIAKILRENDISYMKWDKNRDITENYSAWLGNRQGELGHRYMLGVYALAQKITSEFPDLFIEGCAGGGGRFDGGMLYYFPQIWTSDDTDALERTKIQWGTSMCYPLSSMSCHVSACPNHQTQRITPFETRGAVASLGATGYELDLSKLKEEEKKFVVDQIKNYKKIDKLILEGDLYRLSSPFTENYFCEMVVAKDKLSAYVVGERFRGDPCDHNRVLKLYGLDDNLVYCIEELNITASGKVLSGLGVILPKLPDCGSWTWHINQVKQ
ncbi:MAG TPA: alpha-galactosidase [Clostridia bacterium]